MFCIGVGFLPAFPELSIDGKEAALQLKIYDFQKAGGNEAGGNLYVLLFSGFDASFPAGALIRRPSALKLKLKPYRPPE